MAIITRWRMPPDSWCGCSCARRLASGMPTTPQHLDRAIPRLAAADRGVLLYGLGDLIAAGEDRIERGHRLLEDHAHLVASDVAHVGVALGEQVLAVEQDLAGDDPAGALDQPHDATGW